MHGHIIIEAEMPDMEVNEDGTPANHAVDPNVVMSETLNRLVAELEAQGAQIHRAELQHPDVYAE